MIPVEIERKFLVTSRDCSGLGPGRLIRQAYLSQRGGVTVRVRCSGQKAWLTVKSRTGRISQAEFEYEIPTDHAEFLMATGRHPPIKKIRYKVSVGGLDWVVDEFLGANAGLVLAEIELDDPNQNFAIPTWLGQEVSGDPRYRNSSLYRRPLSQWKQRDDTHLVMPATKTLMVNRR